MEPPDIAAVRQNAIDRNPQQAQKMISPLQGAFMSHLVSTNQPKTILELGCHVGYSALWMAHGMLKYKTTNGAKLYTCERNQDIARIAEQNTKGYADLITVIKKPADDVLDHWSSDQKLDLIFIDANKSASCRYYGKILDRDLLSQHGQIIVDNVLFHGQVHTITEETKQKGIAQMMFDFNSYVANDIRTTQVLLPVFDGMLFISKTQ